MAGYTNEVVVQEGGHQREGLDHGVHHEAGTIPDISALWVGCADLVRSGRAEGTLNPTGWRVRERTPEANSSGSVSDGKPVHTPKHTWSIHYLRERHSLTNPAGAAAAPLVAVLAVRG